MSKARTEKLALDGETYELRWDMNAISIVEELTGDNGFIGFHVTVRNVRAAIFAGLCAAAAAKGKDAPLTLLEVGSMFADEMECMEVLPVVQRLMGRNMPEKAEDKDSADPPAPDAPQHSPSATP